MQVKPSQDSVSFVENAKIMYFGQLHFTILAK